MRKGTKLKVNIEQGSKKVRGKKVKKTRQNDGTVAEKRNLGKER